MYFWAIATNISLKIGFVVQGHIALYNATHYARAVLQY